MTEAIQFPVGSGPVWEGMPACMAQGSPNPAPKDGDLIIRVEEGRIVLDMDSTKD